MEEASTITGYPSYDNYIERWDKTSSARSRCVSPRNGQEAAKHVSGLVTRFDDHGVVRMVMLCVTCRGILTEDAVLV